MLTDDEKARILAEEMLRTEIRAELASKRKPSSARSRAWEFFNSALGLWLLSAVVLTSVGGLFTHWQSEKAKERAQLEKNGRLNTEISCRFLPAIMVDPNNPPTDLPRRVLLAPGRDTACSSDFSQHNLASLVDEFARTTPDSALGKLDARLAAIRTREFHLEWVDKPLSRQNSKEFFDDLGRLGGLQWWIVPTSTRIIDRSSTIVYELGPKVGE